MSCQSRLLEDLFDELQRKVDGLPLERMNEEARERLQEDLNEILRVFLDRLRICRRCCAASEVCDTAEAENEERRYKLFKQCE